MLWHLPYPRLKPGMLCPQPDEFQPHTCLLNPDVNSLPCRVRIPAVSLDVFCLCCGLPLRQDASRTAASVGEIQRHAGLPERSMPQHSMVSLNSMFLDLPSRIHRYHVCVAHMMV